MNCRANGASTHEGDSRIVALEPPALGVARYGVRREGSAPAGARFVKPAPGRWLVFDVPVDDASEDIAEAVAELGGRVDAATPRPTVSFPLGVVHDDRSAIEAIALPLNALLPFLAVIAEPDG